MEKSFMEYIGLCLTDHDQYENISLFWYRTYVVVCSPDVFYMQKDLWSTSVRQVIDGGLSDTQTFWSRPSPGNEIRYNGERSISEPPVSDTLEIEALTR